MAIAVTFPNKSAIFSMGPLLARVADIALDSSYPSGGYSLSGAASIMGLKKILGLIPLGSVNAVSQNLIGQLDAANNKLRVGSLGATAADLIVEEVVTVASNAGTLASVPAYILGIEVTAGTVTGAFRSIPVGETPVTTQVAVNFLTGGLTFLGTDAVTSVRVTYIPLGVGPFVEANRVVDEAVTLASAGVNLANRAALIQHVFNDTATGADRLPKIVPVGEAPGANEIAIDINNAGATTLTVNAAQNTNAGKVTYWKFSAIGAKYGWTDQADITVTSDAILLAEVLDISGIWIPAFGEVVVGETGAAANLQARVIGPSGAVGANVAVFSPALNKISFAAGDAYATIEMAWISLLAEMMTEGAEAAASTNLTGKSLRFLVIGQ